MSIPRHTRHRNDSYPNTQRPVERNPGANAIAGVDDAFSAILYPSDSYDIMGGGVDQPSLDDAITADPVEGHNDPERPVNDWQTQSAHLDVRYDEEYGYTGLSGKQPLEVVGDTAEDARNLDAFQASSYKGAMLTRDVATVANYNTFNVMGGDILPILGENWARKRAVLKALAANTVAIVIGRQDTLVSVTNEGAGGYILAPGDTISVENTDSVFAVLRPADIAVGALLSVMDEAYER